MQDELLYIVEHAASFFDGVEDGGEVVVGEDYFRGVFGHVGAGFAHGNADVGAFEGRRVVDAIASLEGLLVWGVGEGGRGEGVNTNHGRKGLASVQCFYHSDFGLGSTSRDN